MKPILPDQINQQDGDLITAYLRHELDTTDIAAFEERRRTDPPFNDLVKKYIKLAAATRMSDLDSKLELLHAHSLRNPNAAQEREAVVASHRRRLGLMRMAAAIGLILAVAAGIRIFMPASQNQLFEAHFSNQIIPGRGELSSEQTKGDMIAFDLYAREDYKGAAREFDRLLDRQPDSEYLLYAAVSHLGAGHTKRAAELLERSLTLFPKYKPELVLLQALTYIRQGDPASAKELLDNNAALVQDHSDLDRLQKELLVD